MTDPITPACSVFKTICFGVFALSISNRTFGSPAPLARSMATAAKALFENVRTEHNVMTATPRPLSKRMTVLRTAMTQGMLGGMIPPNMGFRVIKGTDTQSGNSRSAQRLRSKIGHRNVGADG